MDFRRPPLLEFLDAEGQVEGEILPGENVCVVVPESRDIGALVDELMLPAASAPARLRHGVGGRNPGLVCHEPLLLAELGLRENLALVAGQAHQPLQRDFDGRVAEALTRTGLLDGVDLEVPAGTLPWTTRVEASFIQAWLKEPQWLLFDRVFNHPAGAGVAHLPGLFRRAFPLRTVCYLASACPDPALTGAYRCFRIS